MCRLNSDDYESFPFELYLVVGTGLVGVHCTGMGCGCSDAFHGIGWNGFAITGGDIT